MRKAISERLDELASAAERIRARIDDPAGPPPGLLLCRAAVDIDAPRRSRRTMRPCWTPPQARQANGNG